VQEAVKLRQQLETLAGQTVKLAADGDEGAKTVVDQMKQQGVTLNPQRKVTGRRIPLTRGSWIGEYPLVFSSPLLRPRPAHRAYRTRTGFITSSVRSSPIGNVKDLETATAPRMGLDAVLVRRKR